MDAGAIAAVATATVALVGAAAIVEQRRREASRDRRTFLEESRAKANDIRIRLNGVVKEISPELEAPLRDCMHLDSRAETVLKRGFVYRQWKDLYYAVSALVVVASRDDDSIPPDYWKGFRAGRIAQAAAHCQDRADNYWAAAGNKLNRKWA